jgi:hypothetical protein
LERKKEEVGEKESRRSETLLIEEGERKKK